MSLECGRLLGLALALMRKKCSTAAAFLAQCRGHGGLMARSWRSSHDVSALVLGQFGGRGHRHRAHYPQSAVAAGLSGWRPALPVNYLIGARPAPYRLATRFN